jgi:hypothetical protein
MKPTREHLTLGLTPYGGKDRTMPIEIDANATQPRVVSFGRDGVLNDFGDENLLSAVLDFSSDHINFNSLL